ncbi:MAG: NAD-dependent protein deacetylase [Woeseiaceae bacterium]|nr:NAD-dependent protein deacetylase [Woeseiaceae bacterium]
MTTVDLLGRFLLKHRKLMVLSGAGCSTDSGIPDYRDEDGNWKHSRPVQFGDFLRDAGTRRHYWARSFAGWQRISRARPNAAHAALAALEQCGRLSLLITQNVDNLHRIAGSRNVVDLHGVLHQVRCLGCGDISPRETLQHRLSALNPGWQADAARFAPDGDAVLDVTVTADFAIADCDICGGLLKPDVVFFGESVPPDRVQRARQHLAECDALLVIGSSLMVWSGFRFARLAAESGKPLAIINRGKTRADDLAYCKVEAGCAETLSQVLPQVLRESGAADA